MVLCLGHGCETKANNDNDNAKAALLYVPSGNRPPLSTLQIDEQQELRQNVILHFSAGCNAEAYEDIIKRYHQDLSSTGLTWSCSEVNLAIQRPPSHPDKPYCKLEVYTHSGTNGKELTPEEEEKIVKDLLPRLGDRKIKQLARQPSHITTYGCRVSKRTTGYAYPGYGYYYYLTCVYTKPKSAHCPRK